MSISIYCFFFIFFLDQLNQIRKSSLAGIICQNSDNLTYITPDVMKTASEDNKRIPCSEIPLPDISYWKESDSANETFSMNAVNTRSQILHGSQNPRNQHYLGNKTINSNLTIDSYEKLDNNSFSGTNNGSKNIKQFNNVELPEWIIRWASNGTLRSEKKVDVKSNYNSPLFNNEIRPSHTAGNIYPDELCNFTMQVREVEVFSRIKRDRRPSVKILISSFQRKILMWNLNDTDSLLEAFTFQNESGIFAFKSGKWYNATCAILRPECLYYSKVVFGDLVNSTNIFEVSATNAASECSIIAPVVLQGHYLNTDTFLWNGNITVYMRKPVFNLDKEEELSLHIHSKRKPINLSKVTGTFTLRERTLWNGTLPVVFNQSELSWYTTEDTLVYPVSWSGSYDVSSFEGVFLIPSKSNGTISWHVGSFSVNLPDKVPNFFTDLIQANRVYASAVYLTDNPAGINRFDASVFNLIEGWVFVDYSQIILTGHFDKNGGFLWSGDISVLMPPPLVDLPSTTYRPYGKYLFTVNAIDLYAQLHKYGSVVRWWSGVLPPIVLIPSGVYDERLYANILSKFLIWSYSNDTVSNGSGQFKMYDRDSEIQLFGDFEFNFDNLMKDIWTSSLAPNTTYYSPVLMQYERITFDFGDDMPERMKKLLYRPELGVLVPITLLGEFHENRTLFKWNHKCLVTVIDV